LTWKKKSKAFFFFSVSPAGPAPAANSSTSSKQQHQRQHREGGTCFLAVTGPKLDYETVVQGTGVQWGVAPGRLSSAGGAAACVSHGRTGVASSCAGASAGEALSPYRRFEKLEPEPRRQCSGPGRQPGRSRLLLRRASSTSKAMTLQHTECRAAAIRESTIDMIGKETPPSIDPNPTRPIIQGHIYSWTNFRIVRQINLDDPNKQPATH
jgi:hypothetical protein